MSNILGRRCRRAFGFLASDQRMVRSELVRVGLQITVHSVRAFKQRQRWIESSVPAEESNVVEGIDNGSFQMDHHLQVRHILNIVGIDEGDASIDYYVLGVESTEDRANDVVSSGSLKVECKGTNR